MHRRFEGNNGAGKSTLIKCLNRILKPQKVLFMYTEKISTS